MHLSTRRNKNFYYRLKTRPNTTSSYNKIDNAPVAPKIADPNTRNINHKALHPNRANNYMNVSYNVNSAVDQGSRPGFGGGNLAKFAYPSVPVDASANVNHASMNALLQLAGSNGYPADAFAPAYHRVYEGGAHHHQSNHQHQQQQTQHQQQNQQQTSRRPQQNNYNRNMLNYLMGHNYLVENGAFPPAYPSNVTNPNMPFESYNAANQATVVNHDRNNIQAYYNFLKYSMAVAKPALYPNNVTNPPVFEGDAHNAAALRQNNNNNNNNKNEPALILKNRYVCSNLLGKGAFGRVYKAYDLGMDREVAVKIIDIGNVTLDQTTTELAILDDLNRNDPLNFHVVRKLDHFQHLDDQVVVFEMMDCTLYDKLRQRLHVGFNLSEVKEIAVKLLLCLCFIWKRRIIHCDLKPENIMYYSGSVEHQQGMRLNNSGMVQLQLPGVAAIKVVDFGSSTYFGQQKYSYIQSRFYRAPEVILQIPYDEKIDVWSMGCVLGELVHGDAMFTGRDEYDQMKRFVHTLGYPPDEMLTKAKNIQMVANLFQESRTSSIRQFLASTKNQANLCDASYLEDANGVQVYPTLERFIADILVYDPRKRPDPCTLFLHPFITNLVTVNPSLMGFLALRSNNGGEYCQCATCLNRARY